MRILATSVLTVLCLSILLPGAWADGGMFPTQRAGSAASADQRAIVVFDGTHETLILQTGLQVTNMDVVEELGGLPSIKVHCSVLAEQAIVAALRDYYDKHPEKEIPPELAKKAQTRQEAEPQH